MIKVVSKLLANYKSIVLILFISVILRLILIWHGGQCYFPDETRYLNSSQLSDLWLHGKFAQSMTILSTIYSHTAFVFIAAALQFLSYFILKLTTFSNIPLDNSFFYSQFNLKFSAFCLSLSSVASIFLVYKISQRTGAEKSESLTAAFLMACSNEMFYYSRHLLPYDMAMAFALLGLWMGLKKDSSMGRSFICGLTTGFAYMLYDGAFILSLIAIMLNIVVKPRHVLTGVIRAIANLIGFLTLPGLLTLISVETGNKNFISGKLDFLGTVNQGVFSEGWRLPWEYMWHTEHLILLLWIAAVFIALGPWLFSKYKPGPASRALQWLLVLGLSYFLFGFFSVVLKKFVIYGRTVRELTPFFCLLTACAFDMTGVFRRSKLLLGGILLLVFLQAAINFRTPLLQKFPPEVQEYISKRYGWVGQANTVLGPSLSPGRINNPLSRYVLFNAQNDLYPIEGSIGPIVGNVLYKTPHPLEFLPYQYEGYDPHRRFILHNIDISIRLIEVKNDPVNDLLAQ